jgi:cellulose synthase/poly-beta-1,6-N-acetylglucosamine synthase-like glycosyltransferase
MMGMDLISILNYSIAFFSLFTVLFFILLFIRYRKNIYVKPAAKDWEPIVSIVIPAYNEADHIEKTLESLLSLDYPKDKLDLVVVDDGSSDDTYEIASRFRERGVQVFTKENSGKGAALNYGIKHAKGELVATMDADSIVTKNTISELLPLFDEDDVMAVTPAVKVAPENKLIVELQRIEYLMILFSRKLLSFIDSVPVTPGPFSMFRKSVFDKVGGFDEHNLVEDQEICLRIQSAHFKVRSSMSAIVYTDVPKTMGDLLKQRIRWQRGGLRNYWKYRFMIRPEYGDFGMFFVPLNYITIISFFLILGLMINAYIATPYYTKYIWVDSIGMGFGLITIIGALVLGSTLLWLYLSVRAFNEKVPIHNLIFFLLFYWYLMVGYNVMTAVKEIRREPTTW